MILSTASLPEPEDADAVEDASDAIEDEVAVVEDSEIDEDAIEVAAEAEVDTVEFPKCFMGTA